MAALVTHAKAAGTSTATTSAIDTTGANLLVAKVSHLPSTTGFSISDSKSNTWIEAAASYNSISTKIRIFYAKSPTVGTGHTFTISGTSLYGTIGVLAFSGADLTSPEDVHNGSSEGSATSLATGSITPSANGAIIVAGFAGGSGSSTYIIDSGFSVTDTTDFLGGGSGYTGGAAAYLLQGSAAAINPTWSWTGTSGASSIIVSFKTATSFTLTAETGVFTLSGKAAGLNVGRILPAATGAFVLTGSAANFLVEIPSLTAEAGVFTLSGSNATLSIGSVWRPVVENTTVWTPK